MIQTKSATECDPADQICIFPRCAVLLAAYNGERWILEQIESILSQKDVDVFLFISVDLSDDSTHLLCEQVAKINPNVFVLPYGDRFGGPAPNFFRLVNDVAIDEFDIFALADQDDIWFDHKLHRAWVNISSGSYDVYSSDVKAFWPDGRSVNIVKSMPQKEFDYLFEAAGPGCTYVFTGSAFRSLQSFLRMNRIDCSRVQLHDWLFYAYCRSSGFSWFIDSEVGLYYRQHEGNQVGVNKSFDAYKKRISLIRSGWYKNQVYLISRLCCPYMATKVRSRLFIIFNILKLRRDFRDRLFLFAAALLGAY